MPSKKYSIPSSTLVQHKTPGGHFDKPVSEEFLNLHVYGGHKPAEPRLPRPTSKSTNELLSLEEQTKNGYVTQHNGYYKYNGYTTMQRSTSHARVYQSAGNTTTNIQMSYRVVVDLLECVVIVVRIFLQASPLIPRTG